MLLRRVYFDLALGGVYNQLLKREFEIFPFKRIHKFPCEDEHWWKWHKFWHKTTLRKLLQVDWCVQSIKISSPGTPWQRLRCLRVASARCRYDSGGCEWSDAHVRSGQVGVFWTFQCWWHDIECRKIEYILAANLQGFYWWISKSDSTQRQSKVWMFLTPHSILINTMKAGTRRHNHFRVVILLLQNHADITSTEKDAKILWSWWGQEVLDEEQTKKGC